MKTKVTAMINLAYFAANFDHEFIEKCWGDVPHLVQHLTDKFLSHASGRVINAGAFMKFFFELSRENQIKLCQWIDENYEA